MTPSTTPGKLLVVGNADVVHVGAHLAEAAVALGCPVVLMNTEQAFSSSWVIRTMNWHLRGHRPNRLTRFSREVVDICRNEQPRWLVATGIAPLEGAALQEIRQSGVSLLNYLTDDPWNPSHAAPWFMDAIGRYDWIFSTRRSNLDDLRRYGCARVAYLPFAYAPGLHFPETPSPVERAAFAADVVFAGGADADRIPLLVELVRSGFEVALYGGYWARCREMAPIARGHADPHRLRKAVAGAKVALCLVRRANRDGNAMRTFEVAAMGACMLVEYTDEHREILGEDGDAVVYFRSTEEMLARLRWLLSANEERDRLGAAVRARITRGRNTYGDRLATMLAAAGHLPTL